MLQRIIPVAITLLVIILGYCVRKHNISKLYSRRNFTIEFQNNFVEMAEYFIKHFDLSTPAYNQFMHDVDAIHLELGRDSIAGYMHDNLTGTTVREYQPLANIVNEMRMAMSLGRNSIVLSRLDQAIGNCDDILRRHVGNLDRMIEDEEKNLHNPFVCFGEGIRAIIRTPGKILVWLGLLSDNHEQTFYGSIFFKIIGWIVTVIGFISAIMTIVLGWDQFRDIVGRLF